MSRSFVLSELQAILFVSQNRLEMGASRQIRREKLIVYKWLWPRVEMSRLFVLSELQPFLYIELCRIEMQPRRSKLTAFLQPESSGSCAGRVRQLSLDEALDDILF